MDIQADTGRHLRRYAGVQQDRACSMVVSPSFLLKALGSHGYPSRHECFSCCAFQVKNPRLTPFFLFLHVTAPTFSRVSSIKLTVAAMLLVVLTLALLLPSIKAFVTPKQRPQVGLTAISLPTTSKNVFLIQAQCALQPQRPYFTTVHISTTTLDVKSSAFVFWTNSSTVGSSPVVISSKDSQAVITVFSVGGIEILEAVTGFPVGETGSPVEGTGSPLGATGSPLGATRSPLGGTGSPAGGVGEVYAITVDFLTPTAAQSSQTTAVSSLTNDTPAEITTSTTVLARQTSGTQPFLVPGSSTSLPFYGTTTPDLPKTPPPLTISGQTLTANSLNQYEIDGQTLTPGGVAVISGTTISLAPDESAIVVGSSTETLSAKVTTGSGSGSNVTEVQPFRGTALGARDGLWSSSMVMLLVGIAVLLWL